MNSNKNSLNISGTGKLEGDNITLENCEARVVRGKNIEIGKNCNIKNVEYSGSIKIDPKSKVEKSYKI
ncbi:MAG: hypothetical protein ACRCX2_03500 [Paraclostridium sp.]